MNMKTCRVCGEPKPMSCYSVNRAKKDGLHYNCKPCDAAKARAWHHSNPEKAIARGKAWRTANIESARQKDRERYYQDKPRYLADRKEYYKNNKDKIIASVLNWRSKNREKTIQYTKNWERENPERKLATVTARRMRKRRAMPKWLSAIHMAQIQELYDVAAACYAQTGIRHHVDHIFPIKGDNVSGLHVPWNLRVLSAEENLSKGNDFPIEYIHQSWGHE